MKRAVRAIGLVAITATAFASGSGALAAPTPNVTIQKATLISPEEVLLTGTSTCDSVTVGEATLTEQNGGFGAGFRSIPSGSSNWAVTVYGINFIKGRADAFVATNCGNDQRTISVQP